MKSNLKNEFYVKILSKCELHDKTHKTLIDSILKPMTNNNTVLYQFFSRLSSTTGNFISPKRVSSSSPAKFDLRPKSRRFRSVWKKYLRDRFVRKICTTCPKRTRAWREKTFWPFWTRRQTKTSCGPELLFGWPLSPCIHSGLNLKIILKLGQFIFYFYTLCKIDILHDMEQISDSKNPFCWSVKPDVEKPKSVKRWPEF